MSGVDLMDRLIDAHNRRDAEALKSYYAPGAGVRMDGWDQAIDLQSWIAVHNALRESFPDLFLRRETVVGAEGVVMAEVRMTGTNTGPLHPSTADRLVLRTDVDALPPTGRVMDVVGVVVLEHSGDLVTGERHYWPAVDQLVQLGLVTLGEPAEVAR